MSFHGDEKKNSTLIFGDQWVTFKFIPVQYFQGV